MIDTYSKSHYIVAMPYFMTFSKKYVNIIKYGKTY